MHSKFEFQILDGDPTYPLPQCSPKERWQKETTYAAMKKKRVRAIKLFDSSHTFVLFSDGHDWCRENLRDDVKFIHIENETEIVDLYLMSLMSHNIIYNSTFPTIPTFYRIYFS